MNFRWQRFSAKYL